MVVIGVNKQLKNQMTEAIGERNEKQSNDREQMMIFVEQRIPFLEETNCLILKSSI